jgi:hypothetical protein
MNEVDWSKLKVLDSELKQAKDNQAIDVFKNIDKQHAIIERYHRCGEEEVYKIDYSQGNILVYSIFDEEKGE